MFDIGWTEMMVVAIVAILFVGPKELPGMLRTFGKSVKKIRAMAGDFQQQFDEAVKDAELDGIKDTINDVRNLDPTKAIKDKLNPLTGESVESKTAAKDSNDYDPKELFDETKAPDDIEPVKVDVDAALERQRKIDADFAKVAPSSGANAVPGFGGPAADPLPVDTKPDAKPASPKKSSTAKKSAPKTAVKKATSKAALKKTPAKKASIAKPAAKSKTADAKKAPAKSKPSKKAKA